MSGFSMAMLNNRRVMFFFFSDSKTPINCLMTMKAHEKIVQIYYLDWVL